MYIYCYYCIYCQCPQTYSHKGLKHISVRKCQKKTSANVKKSSANVKHASANVNQKNPEK
jgi:hypothetical protein